MLKDKCLLEDFDLVEEIEDQLGESICGGLAGFRLMNATDYTVTYAVQPPGSEKWTKYSLAAGRGRLHYSSNETFLDWEVRYDQDRSNGVDIVARYLNPSIGTKSGITQTADYGFTQKGDLLTINPRNETTEGGEYAYY